MVNLKEYIHPEMDILFLALNAPEVSNTNAHWFSRNLSFWNLLYDAGLIIQRISSPMEGDELVFGGSQINFNHWVYGVTDLNNEVVETNSHKIKIEQRHIDRIMEILQRNKVSKLCLMHEKVGTAIKTANVLQDATSHRYGFIGKIGQTEVYEVPFHNASIANKAKYYRSLMDNTNILHRDVISSTIQVQSEKSEKSTNRNGTAFIVPSAGNSITQKDIEKGVLRITVEFKHYFPSVDSTVLLLIGNVEKLSLIHI